MILPVATACPGVLLATAGIRGTSGGTSGGTSEVPPPEAGWQWLCERIEAHLDPAAEALPLPRTLGPCPLFTWNPRPCAAKVDPLTAGLSARLAAHLTAGALRPRGETGSSGLDPEAFEAWIPRLLRCVEAALGSSVATVRGTQPPSPGPGPPTSRTHVLGISPPSFFFLFFDQVLQSGCDAFRCCAGYVAGSRHAGLLSRLADRLMAAAGHSYWLVRVKVLRRTFKTPASIGPRPRPMTHELGPGCRGARGV